MDYEVGSRCPKPGDRVKVVQKKDYAGGILTEGIVKEVLSSKQLHPRGHKVRLTSGVVGRAQEFISQPKQEPSSSQTPTVSYTPSGDDLV